ncbi:MAG: hypothetical protein FWC76_07205 [Defluviitaleaceae bacterium]|nr:hypothetical protein [Defluviitaleaceae bacterium]
MTKKMLGFISVLLFMLFALAACDADVEDNPEFVGTWLRAPVEGAGTMNAQVYTFHSGGEGAFQDGRSTLGVDDVEMTWNVEGSRLELFIGGQLSANVYYFEFENEDTLLFRRVGWPDGMGFVLTRIAD